MRRGCIQDLPSINATECLQSSDNCKSCQTTNCNRKVKFQECFVCDSKNDPHCARNLDSTTWVEVCKTYSSNCTFGIDAEGYTHRQCDDIFADTVNQIPGYTYRTCEGDNCNKEVFVANQLKCYQCQEPDEGCDMTSTNSSKQQPEPCSIFSDYNQCFTYVDAGKSFRHIF